MQGLEQGTFHIMERVLTTELSNYFTANVRLKVFILLSGWTAQEKLSFVEVRVLKACFHWQLVIVRATILFIGPNHKVISLYIECDRRGDLR